MVATTCTDTATVLRATFSTDAGGGVSTDWRTVGTYPARFVSGTDREAVPGGGIEALSTWSMMISATADIAPRDRVQIAAQGGMVLDVVGTSTGTTDNLLQHVMLEVRAV